MEWFEYSPPLVHCLCANTEAGRPWVIQLINLEIFGTLSLGLVESWCSHTLCRDFSRTMRKEDGKQNSIEIVDEGTGWLDPLAGNNILKAITAEVEVEN